MKRTKLFVVGTGIRFGMQLTREAQAAIEGADLVLYVVTESLTARAIEQMNGKARSLSRHYATGRSRRETYDRMVEEIISELRLGQRVCAVFYGHPGVGVDPGHEAILEARKLGYRAEMLPGISAADCLYADLSIDPADGLNVYEATDYLLRGRRPDTTAGLVLWQAGAVALRGPFSTVQEKGLEVLRDRLADQYAPDHPVVVYEAAVIPAFDASIQRITIQDLTADVVRLTSTLYIPPLLESRIDADMAGVLGITI